MSARLSLSSKAKSILLLTTPIVTAFVLSMILQITILSNPDAFTTWLSSFGPFVILMYAILQLITIIIGPIGGLFMYIAVLAIFKPFWGLVLIYLVTTPTYLVNFYLARRFGRPLVEKIIGKHSMKKVDEYAEDAGNITLLLLRIFQSGLFDYISYGAGLTKVRFRDFIWINFLGGIPASLISYFILTRFDNFTVSIIALLATSYVLIGISIALRIYLKKHHSSLFSK